MGRKQQRADRGPAEAVEPQRAVRFEHMAVRAHPAGLPAAAGEIPLAGQAIAAVDRSRARSVRGSPGHDAARIGKDGVIGRGLQIGGNQRGTVGDEYVPRDRGVMPGELFDRRHVERRRRLAAISGTRQQHAEQPRVMEPPQQRLGDAPRALDLVGCGCDLRSELAGAGDRVLTAMDVHAPPQTGRAIAADRPDAVKWARIQSGTRSTMRAARSGAGHRHGPSPPGRLRLDCSDCSHSEQCIPHDFKCRIARLVAVLDECECTRQRGLQWSHDEIRLVGSDRHLRHDRHAEVRCNGALQCLDCPERHGLPVRGVRAPCPESHPRTRA